jgi:hydroxymethylpyrimidine kinase/phosphomethylpyrimidine kinase
MTNGHDEDKRRVPVCLTIAGSDSGGGAGIQADLNTFAALGVFGTSAITCVTAQSPDEVTGIEPIIIRVVAESVAAMPRCRVVVDPVMIATSGARLLRRDAVRLLCRRLIPLAAVITPNVPEAEVLGGVRIRTVNDLKSAARLISRKYGVACVVKGGHLGGRRIVDVLSHDDQLVAFSSDRVRVAETHGTGCCFSAALTAWLARGKALPDAVESAKRFVAGALAHAIRAGRHCPLNGFWQT